MKRFVTSRLGEEHRDALERMFYFHPAQSYFSDALIQHIQKFGSPKIELSESLLSISVPGLPGALTFYAVEENGNQVKLLGVMVIHRTEEKLLEMHHIAINPEVVHNEKQESFSIAVLLIRELCRIGRRIRGIEKIKLAYHRGEIPVTLDFSIKQDFDSDQ